MQKLIQKTIRLARLDPLSNKSILLLASAMVAFNLALILAGLPYPRWVGFAPCWPIGVVVWREW